LKCDIFETCVSCSMNAVPLMCCWNFKHDSSKSLRTGLNRLNNTNDPKTHVAGLQILIIEVVSKIGFACRAVFGIQNPDKLIHDPIISLTVWLSLSGFSHKFGGLSLPRLMVTKPKESK